MTIKRGAVLVAALLLAGCTSSAIMETWIGNPDSSLYASWGKPDELLDLSDGQSLATWYALDTARNLRCTRTFTISAQHFVTAAANTCRL